MNMKKKKRSYSSHDAKQDTYLHTTIQDGEHLSWNMAFPETLKQVKEKKKMEKDTVRACTPVCVCVSQ